MRKSLAITFFVFALPLQAEETKSFFLEPSVGVLGSIELLTDNYDSAYGARGELWGGWNEDEFGYFLVTQAQSYSQSSRHAQASVDLLGAGLGIMINASEQIRGYGHFVVGSGEYTLKHDTQGFVKKGTTTFTKITAGARFYFLPGPAFQLFAGPEVSYNTLSWEYPESYGDDESHPVHLNIGGAAGIRVSF